MSNQILKDEDRVKTIQELVPIIEALKADGKRTVFASGCFDIIHPGHVGTFEDARAQGDVLIVGINSDASVHTYKGPKRPIVDEKNRALLKYFLRWFFA